MPTYDSAYEAIRAEVLSRMDVGCEVSDESIRAAIDEAVGEYSRNTYLPLALRQQIYNEIFYELRQLDIIQELIEDPSITDVKHAILIQGRTSKSLEIRGFCYFI